MRWLFVIVIVLAGGLANAQSWSEPKRGTATRTALMDALRPHAEWQLGAPVEFVVHDLRRAGNLAYASITAQRPGGHVINQYKTPGYRRGDIDPEFSDGTSIQALYRKSGETWVAVHWAIGSTDVWFAYDEMCRTYAPVIPEFCQGMGN